MADASQNQGRVQLRREGRRAAVMTVFRESDTPCSTTVLSQKTGFSFPVVTSIINELLDEELVEKIDETVSTGGRPSALFRLKAHSVYAIGVSIERKLAVFLVMDITGEVVEEQTIHQYDMSPTVEGWDRLLDQIVDFVGRSNVPRDRIIGAGISFGAGAERAPIRGVQDRQALLHRARETLGFPVRIENDAQSMTIAEKRLGLAKTKRNVICVLVDWGIGMGMIIEDRIYLGAGRNIGELGHIIIDDNGPLCYCGKRGCLETYASGQAMVRTCREQLKAGTQSMLMGDCDGDLEKIDQELIVKAALRGDLFAIELIESIAKVLGREISNLVKLFDPEEIILSGTLAEAGRFIVAPIQATIDKLDLYYRESHVQVTQSTLGHRAAALGAASMVLDDVFGTPPIGLSPPDDGALLSSKAPEARGPY